MIAFYNIWFRTSISVQSQYCVLKPCDSGFLGANLQQLGTCPSIWADRSEWLTRVLREQDI